MYCYCNECEGVTYHVDIKLERKDGLIVDAVECEECEMYWLK